MFLCVCNPGCPGTQFIDHVSIKLRNLPASASSSQLLGLKVWCTLSIGKFFSVGWFFGFGTCTDGYHEYRYPSISNEMRTCPMNPERPMTSDSSVHYSHSLQPKSSPITVSVRSPCCSSLNEPSCVPPPSYPTSIEFRSKFWETMYICSNHWPKGQLPSYASLFIWIEFGFGYTRKADCLK